MMLKNDKGYPASNLRLKEEQYVRTKFQNDSKHHTRYDQEKTAKISTLKHCKTLSKSNNFSSSIEFNILIQFLQMMVSSLCNYNCAANLKYNLQRQFLKKKWIILLFMMLLINATQGTPEEDCQESCPANCICSLGECSPKWAAILDKCCNKVNCTGRNSIPSSNTFPPLTSWFIAESSSILKISDFGNIRKILVHLELKNNTIQTLSYIQMQALVKLEKLDVSYNFISNIPKSTFKDMSRLKDLNLSFNKLSVLHQDTFKNNRNLEKIGLSGNRLKTLSLELFKMSTNPLSLTLGQNPWICNCDIEWVKDAALLNTYNIIILDYQQIICHEPNVLINQSLVDAKLDTARCAQSYVSCVYKQAQSASDYLKGFIVWEYTDPNENILHTNETCNDLCLANGYFYATVRIEDKSCLCASESSEDKIMNKDEKEWGDCMQACGDVIKSETNPERCGRKVLQSSIMRSSYDVKFSGIRTFSQEEEASISVIAKSSLNCSFIWNFNDSSPREVNFASKSITVKHKYAAAGVYYITVTVSVKEGEDVGKPMVQTYGTFLIVENPISNLNIICPDKISSQSTDNIRLSLSDGTSPRMDWKVKHKDEFIKNSYQEPPGSHYFSKTNMYYSVISSKEGPWRAAQSECQKRKGDLVFISLQEVQDFLMNIKISDGIYWIGIMDKLSEGSYMHLDYQGSDNKFSVTSVKYTNWNPGQPDDNHNFHSPPTSEDCVYLNVSSGSGFWYDDNCNSRHKFICQYSSHETMNKPRHYVGGTAMFGKIPSLTVNISIQQQPNTNKNRYVVLFPETYIQNNGSLNSWEFIDKEPSSFLRLQIYRPQCKDEIYKYLIHSPGCGDFLTNRTVCRKQPCANPAPYVECQNGFYFCSLTRNCLAITDPCIAYRSPTVGDYKLPSYNLIKEYVTGTIGSSNVSAQLVVKGEVKPNIRKHDVIGFGFESSFDLNSLTVKHFPIKCEKSELSVWRQDLYAMEVGEWISENSHLIYDIESTRNINSLWCYLRVQYSQSGVTSVPIASVVNMSNPGLYEFYITAKNDVSTTEEKSCVIELTDAIKSIKLLNEVVTRNQPRLRSASTDSTEDVINVPLNEGFPFSVEVNGGNNVKVNITTSEGKFYQAETVTVYNEDGSQEQVATAEIEVNTQSEVTIQAKAYNEISARSLSVIARALKPITRLEILPAASDRIFVGVPITFKGNVSEGDNVQYEWYVDGLTDFIHIGDSYLILFRLKGIYTLHLKAKNDVSEQSVSRDINVDNINLMTDLEFATPPSVIELGKTLNITAKLLVDINIDIDVTWEYNGVESKVKYLQPHPGLPPNNQIERVYLTVVKEFAFNTNGESQSIKITAETEYGDSISEEHTINVRKPLSTITTSFNPNPGIKDEDVQITIDVMPSSDGSTFDIIWGDSSSKETSTLNTISHKYTTIGDKTVNIEACNDINCVDKTTSIIFYERITDVKLTSNESTELGYPTEVTVALQSGFDFSASNVTYDYLWEPLQIYSNQKNNIAQFEYRTVGMKTIKVTARNEVSTKENTIQVLVFEVVIESVEQSGTCAEVGSEFDIIVEMPTNKYELFEFNVKKDGEADGINYDGNLGNKLKIKHSSPGKISAAITAKSKLSDKISTKTIELCIQEKITSLSVVHNAPVETGTAVNFEINISDGTDVTYKINYGDGTAVIPNVDASITSQSHTYTVPGTYTVDVFASNLVGSKNFQDTVLIQDKISGITFTHDSLFGASVIASNTSYTFTGSYVTGSDISWDWNFGDSTSIKNGKEVQHLYSTIGSYTIELTASNNVSSEKTTLIITVNKPVKIDQLQQSVLYVKKGESVDFTVTYQPLAGASIDWQVDPGLARTTGINTFNYVFATVDNFTITVFVKNQVSEDSEVKYVLCAEEITDLMITSSNFKSGTYISMGDTTFEVLLSDGKPISSTTSGSMAPLGFAWDIIKDGVIVNSYTDGPNITTNFNTKGVYTVDVNVTNGISFQLKSISVTVVAPITTITFVKDSPANAAIINEEVEITATSDGSSFSCSWNDSENPLANGITFKQTYSTAKTYTLNVICSNVINSKTETYTLNVQEEISGLQMDHTSAVNKWACEENQSQTFSGSISLGTDVNYQWTVTDGSGISTVESNNANLFYTFTQIASYIVELEASNLVSTKNITQLVKVQKPVSGLKLEITSVYIETHKSIPFTASVDEGTDVNFTFKIPSVSISLPPVVLDAHTANATYTFSSDGIQDITAEVSNLISSDTKTIQVHVRDPITILDIGGCCQDNQYLEAEKEYTFTASGITNSMHATLQWEVTHKDNSSENEVGSGQTFKNTFSAPGDVTVKLSANNFISQAIKIFHFHIQIPPKVHLSITNIGRPYYTYDTVVLEINTKGDGVKHNVSFDDGTQVFNTNATVLTHVYTENNTYHITVKSFNMIGEDYNSIDVEILMLQCTPPQLSFVSNHTTFQRSNRLLFEVELNDDNCTTYAINYQWHIYKQDNCVITPTSIEVSFWKGIRPNKNIIIIPARSLEIHKYCFVVSVSYEDTYLSDEISAVKQITASKPVAIINGGSMVLTSYSDYTINGEESFDPDETVSDQVPLNASWLCFVEDSEYSADEYFSLEFDILKRNLTSPCSFSIPNSSEYTIPKSYLEPSKEYQFYLTVTKDGGLQQTTSQRVAVLSLDIPSVSITCFSCFLHSGISITSSKQVSLLGTVEAFPNTEKIRYDWTVKRIKSNEETEVTLDESYFTTGLNGENLVLREGVAIPNHLYQFSLRVVITDTGGKRHRGMSQLTLQTNDPPVDGTCQFSNIFSIMDGLTNPIDFKCSGWYDYSAPLVYSVMAVQIVSDEENNVYVLYRGSSEEYEQIYLPLGKVIVTLFVEDQLGSSTSAVSRQVEVIVRTPDGMSITEYLKEKVMGELLDFQRRNVQQDTVNYAAALITVLNEASKSAGYEVDLIGNLDNRYKDRSALRKEITDVTVSLETTTIEDVIPLATVLKECMAVPNEVQDQASITNVSDKLSAMIDVIAEGAFNKGQGTIEKLSDVIIDTISYLVEAVNYNVYEPENALRIAGIMPDVTYSEAFRKDTILKLIEEYEQMIAIVLKGKIQGEEPLVTSTDKMSAVYVRTTPSAMQRSIARDGCTFKIPPQLFCNIDQDTSIFMTMTVFEKNIYTFDMPQMLGVTANSSKVASLSFTDLNGSNIPVNNLDQVTCDSGNQNNDNSQGYCSNNMFQITMASGDQSYMNEEETWKLSNLQGEYDPKHGLNFTEQHLAEKHSVGLQVTNENTDPAVAVYIMVTYTKTYNNINGERDPYVLLLMDTKAMPTLEDNSIKMELTDEDVNGNDHMQYTIYMNPLLENTTTPLIFLNVTNYYMYHSVDIKVAVYYGSCQYLDEESGQWKTDGVYTSPETTFSVSVCCSSHLTAFGSFIINPPNIISVTEIKDLDFSRSVVALITVIVIIVFWLFAMIWARKLDLRDIKKSSLIPLCGPNGSFKYEITIKTAAGMGSGTTANVGICIYGYDSITRSRHLYKKDAFQRGNVDSFQIASDVDLGQIYKIKIWHDNTGLDPAWNVERIFVKDVQCEEKYYFLVNSWLQVYPDDDDEDCLQKVVEVATEEELNNFSQVFGAQMAYGWEDAHLWLSVFERPSQSRFTRVQRVTCCVTLLFTFLVFSAFWYQGYDENGEVSDEDTAIGILRWKDIAVGAIVAVMVFPINMILIVIFKKSKSHVSPIKPWPERTQTAQTIEILDEIIDGRGKRFRPSAVDDVSHFRYTGSKNHLPGQSQFLAELDFASTTESVFYSRSQTPSSNKMRFADTQSFKLKSRLHKSSGTVKSLDLKDKVWSSEDSAVNLSESPTSSDSLPSDDSQQRLVSSSRPKQRVGQAWASESQCSKRKDSQFDQMDNKNETLTNFQSTSLTPKPKKSQLRRRNTAYVRRDVDSATPPNCNPDEVEDGNDFWDPFPPNDANDDSMINVEIKPANLRRTRAANFKDVDELPMDEYKELIKDDVLNDDDEDLDDFNSGYDSDDVPLPEMPPTRDGNHFQSRASTTIGLSPQPNTESYLLPHWCIYLNYILCFVIMAVCIFYIILYGNEFGPSTTLRWLLCTFVSLLESFFLVEPIKVVLLAIFLAMITKPVNPDENDNLVEKPVVEPFENVKNTRVRPPAGFALQQCKFQAKKSQRLDKMLRNLALYSILLSSVAAVASWDKDKFAIFATKSINDAFFNTKFSLPFPVHEPKLMRNKTFSDIRSTYDIEYWLSKIVAEKLFDRNDTTLDNQNINNDLFGAIRIRQQRTSYVPCPINNDLAHNPGGLTEINKNCLTTDQSRQITDNDSDWGPWVYTPSRLPGVLYWGENHAYDDGGYSLFIPANTTVIGMKQMVHSLFSNNWIDRPTSVVFVEFTLYNPAELWFIVFVAMFEIGVTGAVTPSHNVNIVRLFVPSSGVYVDMIFMGMIGIITLLLLFNELRKINNKKITFSIYFEKFTNWINLLVIGLLVTLCVLFVYKEVYMEEVMQSYISNKERFTNFYKIAFYANLVTYTASVLLTVLIIRAVRLFRLFRCWSVFGTTITASAKHLVISTFMLITLILTYAMLGYLIYGQNYTHVVADFNDFPNSIYAMFRAFRGRLELHQYFHANPFFTLMFFLSFYIGVFYIFGSLFAAILINEYKFARIKMKRPSFSVPDYEIKDYCITRIKLRLGIIKPKQFRPTVRFEGMSTPSSRGSFASLDSFDTCFNPGRISQFSNASGFSSSSSDSGLGTPSDHSISIFDYLTHDPPTDTPLDPLHLDYLYDRLSSYSVDMMLKRFERVNELSDDVLGQELNLLSVTDQIKQRKKMQEQSQEIALAASSTTIRAKFSPGSSSSQFGGSLESRVGLSTTSLNSRSRSVLSGDSMLQTVINSMFPSEPQPKRTAYRSSSYAGPSNSDKRNFNRDTVSDDGAILLSAESSRSNKIHNKQEKLVKQRPHSDEGTRLTTTSIISQAQQSRKSLNDITKGKSTKSKIETKQKPKSNINPLSKRSAWFF